MGKDNKSQANQVYNSFDEYQKALFPHAHERKLLEQKEPAKVAESIVKIAVEKAEANLARK
jgi:hypothetical protein